MRKNTKRLIIALVIFSVVSVATAITVPVVLHLNGSNNNDSIKNKTIKKIDIKNRNLIDEILAFDTEEEMKNKVKEINENSMWDEIFTFTNENDKFITNVVSEVIFDLDNNSNNPQGVFTFLYKEGIKANSGASDIRINKYVGLNITNASDYANKLEAATQVLTNSLKDKDFDRQINLYDAWNGIQAPINFVNEIENILIFKEENKVLNWDDVVENVILKTDSSSAIEGGKIDPVTIKINLKPEYRANELDLLEFNSADTLGNWKISLTISDVNDAKKTEVSEYLASLLNGKTFQEQKDEYESWAREIPSELETKIVDIVTFNNGAIDWATAVSGIKINIDYIEAGSKINPIDIKINLNSEYSTIDESKLSIRIDALGDAQKINLTVTNDPNYDNKLEAIRNLLNIQLGDAQNIDDQQSIYDNLPNTVSTVLESLVKDIFILNDGYTDIEWDEAVSNRVEIIINDNPTLIPGAEIPPVKIKIVLTNKYSVNDENDLIINIDGLINAKKISLTISDVNDAKKTEVSDYLAGLLNGKSFQEQKDEYESWAREIPSDLETKIVDIVTFNNGAIDWVTAVSGIKININYIEAGSKINPIDIKINLNSEYSTIDESKLSIRIDALGDAQKINLTVTNDPNYDNKLEAIRNLLNMQLGVAQNIDEQQSIYDSLPNTVSTVLEALVKDIFILNDGYTDIEWNEAVKNRVELIINDNPTLIAGNPIPPVKIKIIFTDKYLVNGQNNLIIDVDGLMNAIDTSTTP